MLDLKLINYSSLLSITSSREVVKHLIIEPDFLGCKLLCLPVHVPLEEISIFVVCKMGLLMTMVMAVCCEH